MERDKAPPPDILVFISDQHTARLMGCSGSGEIDTPHMDAMAADGLRFSSAYTSCPLCAPARCAFLNGRLPANTGMFTNENIMPSELATFAHSLGAAGYDTVLCGRMHFTGQDQRHGFARRIMGDFTPCIQGRGGKRRSDLGPYVNTPAHGWDKHFGGGDSPVLAYDRAVIEAACEELATPHERPLLMVVGTYGPHHTYVAPEDLYRKYLNRVSPPLSRSALEPFPSEDLTPDREHLSTEDIQQLRAAYYGMIEQTDRHLGTLRAAWSGYLEKRSTPGVMVYTSDHGDMAGHRGKWGKTTFFDDAVGIPLLISGDGIGAGQVCTTPVSLLDLNTTLCELAGGPALPEADGHSFLPALEGRALPPGTILSDLWRNRAGRMLVNEDWKYWCFAGDSQATLIDRNADPGELHNVAGDHPDVCRELHTTMTRGWDPDWIAQDQERRRAQEAIFAAWGANPYVPEPDRWVVPESCQQLPAR